MRGLRENRTVHYIVAGLALAVLGLSAPLACWGDNTQLPVKAKKAGSESLTDMTATKDGSPARAEIDGIPVTTTKNFRVYAGDPLHMTSSSLVAGVHYVDIGTTGGLWKTPGLLRMDRQDRYSAIYVADEDFPGLEIIANYFNKPISPGSGTYVDTSRGPALRVRDSLTSNVVVDLDPESLQFSDAATGSLSASFSASIIRMVTGGTLLLENAASKIYIGGDDTDWPADQDGSLHAINSVLAKNDGHFGDGCYVGDPSGNITGTPIYNSHLRSYGNILADPNNADRYGTTGTINWRTLLDDNLQGIGRLSSSADGIMMELADSVNTVSGYPNNNQPTNRNLDLKAGAIRALGALQASGAISTTSTVTAGTGITATTGNITATAGDLIAGDDAFIAGAINAGVAASTTNGHVYVQTTSGATQNSVDHYTDANNVAWQMGNASATANRFSFLGASGKDIELRVTAVASDAYSYLTGAGTNKGTLVFQRGSGTGGNNTRYYRPVASGSSSQTEYTQVGSSTAASFNINSLRSAADSEVLIFNSNGTYATNLALEGRAGFGTTTPPTSGAYVQTPSLDINASTDAGQATIPNGDFSVVVSTTAITATDVVVCTWADGHGATGEAPMGVDIDPGVDFTIYVTGAVGVTGDTAVNWRIIH